MFCNTTGTRGGCGNCCSELRERAPSIQTSKPNHIVLIVQSEDLQSQVALKNMDLALEGTDYRCYTAVLEGKYHPAICISYEINSFPTMLVMDDAGQVLHRELAVRNMSEEKIRSLLQHIASYRTTNL